MGKTSKLKKQLKRKLSAQTAASTIDNTSGNPGSNVVSKKKQKKMAKQNQKQKQQTSSYDDDEDHDNNVNADSTTSEALSSEMKEIAELNFEDAFAAGLAFEQLESYEGALLAFQVAVKHRSDHLEALSHLADVYAAVDQPKQALKTYLQASKHVDADASIWFRLGVTYAALDKSDAAMESYRKALLLTEKSLDELDSEKDSNTDEREDLMKVYSVTLAALANCCGEQGDIDGAVHVYRQAVQKFPMHGNMQYNLATMLMAKGGEKSAIEVVKCLEQAIECSPDEVEFYDDLIEFLEGTNQSQQAEVWRKKKDAISKPESDSAAQSDDEGDVTEDEEEEEGADEESE